MSKSNATGNWFFFLLFCISLALSWFFHKDASTFKDRHELWSDRAGYYIYLPATFFYRFDTHKMPADLDMQTGGGFSIDTLHNKLDTKYTYGVALLASPFFITAGVISRVAGFDSESGFSMLYMRMMGLAGVIYLLMGLWLLKKFLDHYFDPLVNRVVVAVIFMGTNLFYYALIDGIMSHVYSFFLFALFLFTLKKFLDDNSFRTFILLCLVFSLAVLIRPTNILLGLLFFTWDADGPSGWLSRVRRFLKPGYLLSFLSVFFLVFLPQLVYWKYLSGNWIHFSYGDEGFTNWRHPMIAEVLFSPVNGLFTASPVALLFLIGTVMMIFAKTKNGWLVAVVFAWITLVCATWKMWYFGCSFGQRSFIEYYTILAIPLAWLITGVFRNRFFLVKTVVLFLVFFLVYANLRYTFVVYRFDRCYYGSTWDWDHYFRMVEKAGIISPESRISHYENDFENMALCPVVHPSMVFTHSGQYSIPADGKSRTTPLYSAGLYEFRYPWPKMMEVEVWMLSPGTRPADAYLTCTFTREGKPVFAECKPLKDVLSHGKWTLVQKTFIVPDVNDSSVRINIYIDNPTGLLLYADDLNIRFHYGWKR
ncbi:MAG: hypothetical protein ACOYNC_07905 [Bacteroidales bacterium]